MRKIGHRTQGFGTDVDLNDLLPAFGFGHVCVYASNLKNYQSLPLFLIIKKFFDSAAIKIENPFFLRISEE